MRRSRILWAAHFPAVMVIGVLTIGTAAGGQDRRGDLATKLSQQLAASFRVNAVRVDGKRLQIVVNDRELYQDGYTALVTAACTQLGGSAKQFAEIAFGNRFAEQGYVFAAPAKCADILKLAPAAQKAAILAKTHEL